jgi:apolipoprotein N-acyltransferase
LLGGAHLVPLLWWCTLPGLALLAYAVERAASIRRAAMVAGIIGSIKMLLVMSWALTVYPADWLTAVPHPTQFVILSLCWSGTSIVIGTGFALVALLRLTKGKHWLLRALVFAILLLGAENLGALLFSIFSYGPGSSLNTDFGFGMTGFSLADHGVLRVLAPLGGVYILGATLAALAYCLTVVFEKKSWYALGFLVVFIGTGYVPLVHTPLPPMRVAAIGTSFPSFRLQTYDDMRSDQAVTHTAVRTALGAGAEMVLLTEDQRFGYAIDTDALFAELHAMQHVPNAVVVDSYRTDLSTESTVLRAYVYDIDTQKTYAQDKKFLVPLGEYVPSLFSAALATISRDNSLEPMKYAAGGAVIPQDAPTRIPSILFCFENIGGFFAKVAAGSRNPLLMVHPVSHSWFHYHGVLDNEERQTLIVQAMFTGVPILQAGNEAPSVLYAKDGRTYTGITYTTTDKYTITMFDTRR